VLSPIFETKKQSRNILSTEIEEKEREFENEHEQPKIPNQNRITSKIPSTINDEED
jgi:hypothetical protein